MRDHVYLKGIHGLAYDDQYSWSIPSINIPIDVGVSVEYCSRVSFDTWLHGVFSTHDPRWGFKHKRKHKCRSPYFVARTGALSITINAKKKDSNFWLHCVYGWVCALLYQSIKMVSKTRTQTIFNLLGTFSLFWDFWSDGKIKIVALGLKNQGLLPVKLGTLLWRLCHRSWMLSCQKIGVRGARLKIKERRKRRRA